MKTVKQYGKLFKFVYSSGGEIRWNGKGPMKVSPFDVPRSGRPSASLRQAVALACLAAACTAAGAQTPISATPTTTTTTADRGPRVVSQIGEVLIALIDEVAARTVRGGAPFGPFRDRVAAAVLSHPDAMSTLAQAETAAAVTREAQSAYFPQLSGNGAGGNAVTGRDTVLGQPERQRSVGALGVTARQMLYDFGATTRSVEAGQARERAAQARQSTRQSDLSLRASTTWLDLSRARDQLRLADDNVLSRQAIVRLVRERAEVGGGSRADVIRAEARLTDAQATTTAARSRLLGAEAAFREMFGSVPQATPIPADVSLDATAAPLDALARRYGGFRESQAQLEALRSDLAISIARARPTVSLEASVARRDLVGSGLPATDHSLQLVLRHNFYTGGGDTARNDQALSKVLQAEQDQLSLLRQLERALGQTLAEVRNGDEIVAARRDAALAAGSSLRAVRDQFAYNRGTLLDLLRAQEELHAAGSSLVDAAADRAIARFRLLHLAGGLEATFGLPVPAAATTPNPGPR